MIINVAVECLLRKEQSILLGLRKNVRGAGKWAFPAGHQEVGETLYETLVREMREELSIEVEEARLIAVSDTMRDDSQYVHITFEVTRYRGEVQNAEPDRCEELRYFPMDKLPEPMSKHSRRIIETIQSGSLYLP